MSGKHDYYHAVSGAYLFSKNDVDYEMIRNIEKHLPVRVYRSNLPSLVRRTDRRHIRYETLRNGEADGKKYYKWGHDVSFTWDMIKPMRERNTRLDAICDLVAKYRRDGMSNWDAVQAATTILG